MNARSKDFSLEKNYNIILCKRTAETRRHPKCLVASFCASKRRDSQGGSSIVDTQITIERPVEIATAGMTKTLATK